MERLLLSLMKGSAALLLLLVAIVLAIVSAGVVRVDPDAIGTADENARHLFTARVIESERLGAVLDVTLRVRDIDPADAHVFHFRLRGDHLCAGVCEREITLEPGAVLERAGDEEVRVSARLPEGERVVTGRLRAGPVRANERVEVEGRLVDGRGHLVAEGRTTLEVDLSAAGAGDGQESGGVALDEAARAGFIAELARSGRRGTRVGVVMRLADFDLDAPHTFELRIRGEVLCSSVCERELTIEPGMHGERVGNVATGRASVIWRENERVLIGRFDAAPAASSETVVVHGRLLDQARAVVSEGTASLGLETAPPPPFDPDADEADGAAESTACAFGTPCLREDGPGICDPAAACIVDPCAASPCARDSACADVACKLDAAADGLFRCMELPRPAGRSCNRGKGICDGEGRCADPCAGDPCGASRDACSRVTCIPDADEPAGHRCAKRRRGVGERCRASGVRGLCTSKGACRPDPCAKADCGNDECSATCVPVPRAGRFEARCDFGPSDGTPCAGGTCQQGRCAHACAGAPCPDPESQCLEAVCEPDPGAPAGHRCATAPRDESTPCDLGGVPGTCGGDGICYPDPLP